MITLKTEKKKKTIKRKQKIDIVLESLLNLEQKKIYMNHQQIYDQKIKLSEERNSKMREFLRDYDNRIYNPAMKKIRQECKTIGHKFSFHSYNLVRSHCIYKCDYCGASKYETDERG